MSGTWLFGGHWSGHFGHFLLESLTSLWPEPSKVDGLLFLRSFRTDPKSSGPAYREQSLKPWHVDLLDLAGYGGLPVMTVQKKRVGVERLLVPSRSVSLLEWALPEAASLWRRMSERVPAAAGGARKIFLSRSGFHQTTSGWHVRSTADWDEQLDREFSAAGFQVMRPEDLSIRDQIAAIRSADVIAGAAGSALHLSAFARSGTRVLEVGDKRSDGPPQPTQQLIDASCGHTTAFVGQGDSRALTAVLKQLR